MCALKGRAGGLHSGNGALLDVSNAKCAVGPVGESDGQGILEVGLPARLPERLLRWKSSACPRRASAASAAPPRTAIPTAWSAPRSRATPSACIIPTGSSSRCSERAKRGRARSARSRGMPPSTKIAEAFSRATAVHGAESVWPYHSGGTMGIVQRWGIDRLRHALGYSRQKTTICVTPAESGWRAGVGKLTGARSARDGRVRPHRRVGRQSRLDPGQRHDPHRQGARKQRGAKLVVVDVYRTPTVEAADIGLVLRPGTDGALALAMMHVLLKEGFADRDYLAPSHRLRSRRSRRISPTRRRNGLRPSPACRPTEIVDFRPALRRAPSAASCAWASASRARATARRRCTP